VAGAAGLYGGGGYGTAVGESAALPVAGGVHNFPAVMTSFIGRAGPVREVAALLGAALVAAAAAVLLDRRLAGRRSSTATTG
jgi:hypothetical protein